MTSPRSLRARLDRGETLVGTFVKSSDPGIAELLAGAGFDFIVADLEHSSLGLSDVEAITRAADVRSVPVLVRIASHAIGLAGRLLDVGAVGIQVTDVTDPATLAAARDATSFPPQGRRSLALSHRDGRFGQIGLAEYLREAREKVVTVVQVESRDGVAALPLLLAAPTPPDVWFLGPLDLANDLGHGGDQAHPDVQAAFDDVLAVLRRHGAHAGVYARDGADARAWIGRGARLIVVGSDLTLLAGAARDALTACHPGGDAAQPARAGASGGTASTLAPHRSAEEAHVETESSSRA